MARTQVGKCVIPNENTDMLGIGSPRWPGHVHVGGRMSVFGVTRTSSAPAFLHIRKKLDAPVRFLPTYVVIGSNLSKVTFHAALTVLRNLPTSSLSRLLSLDSDCAADSTCDEAEPVSPAPCCTSVMWDETC